MAPNSHLHVSPYQGLCCLSDGDFVDSLVDQALVDDIRVKCLIEGCIRLAQTTVSRLTFVTAFCGKPPNLLSLFGRQVQLLDRIAGRWCRWILGQGGDRQT